MDVGRKMEDMNRVYGEYLDFWVSVFGVERKERREDRSR